MKKLLITIVLAIWFANLSYAQPQFSLVQGSGRHKGLVYNSLLPIDQVEQSPSWLETEPNPPLAARVAVRNSSQYLGTIIKGADNWTVRNIKLRRFKETDKWFFEVEFNVPKELRRGSEGSLFFFLRSSGDVACQV